MLPDPFVGHHPANRDWKVTVPTGCGMYPGARGPRRISDAERQQRQALAMDRYNVVYWSELPRGGHFAAEEQPEIWTKDVRTFFHTGLSTADQGVR